MIKLMENMPEGTVGLEASGKVTEDDYKTVLIPAVTDALTTKDVRLLYVLGEDFDAYSAGAMWADTKLWAEHMKGWQKIAVVTTHRWIHDAVKAFSWLMPGEVRIYQPDELDAAKAWLALPAEM
jgi:hypothetical protein